MSSSIYVALLHHSMLDKRGNKVVTAITNFDIHDISRAARSYGLKGYFLVNPEEGQQRVAGRIISHWQSGGGKDYNPDRAEAFKTTHIVSWLTDAVQMVMEQEGERPKVVMTSARQVEGTRQIGYSELRNELQEKNQAILLVFGTGWGIEDSLLLEADAVLPPIEPAAESNYLHLSVRSAAAIIFDRLLGKRD